MLAVILTLTMLMSAMMVQAFAASSCPVNTTWRGYNLQADMYSPFGTSVYCDVTYGDRAIIYIDIEAWFHHEFTGELRSSSTSSSFLGSEATLIARHDPNYPDYIIAAYATGNIKLYYDGVESNLYTCTWNEI